MMSMLIDMPLLSLIPAAVMSWHARRTGVRVSRAVAALWAVYAIYELAMKLRILCTGECNIRIDLLVIHPALIIVTLAAFVLPLLGWDKPHARHGIDSRHD